jgi:hypothetical protein
MELVQLDKDLRRVEALETAKAELLVEMVKALV